MQSFRTLLAETDPDIHDALQGEERRQHRGIELIASENYTYPEVLVTLGSVLTNKYAEGYPGRRYYGGQEFTDRIEELARTRARQVFRCEHANVQPLSGSPMNQAVYLAFMKPGDTIVGMDLSHGGHLTHGSPLSHMGKLFDFVRYKSIPEERGRIDFVALRNLVRVVRPKILLCGYTSYPRDLDYGEFHSIAEEVGAISMADISHVGGLVAAGVLRNPFDHGFDVVTTTTHKSLRGPRAGMVLCKARHAARLDKSVFPGLQGGPHMNVVAGIAVTLKKALEPEFRRYAELVLENAQTLAAALLERRASLVTGGTDNHMLVLDTMQSFGIDGQEAEEVLDHVGITVSKQVIPDDPRPPLRPSGIRIGTPAATTRGMQTADMQRLAHWIIEALRCRAHAGTLERIRGEVMELCETFPVPGLSPART
ncbi:MAG TPA: serine hydroxymethyltransferase [Polyangiaceae bacterium]